jgi:hypothetical protein
VSPHPGSSLVARLCPSPTELLSAADDLLRDSHPELAGTWPRAVATLCRQALEGAMFDLWRAKAPGVEDASYRAQLLCLRSYLDPALAASADQTWAALSRACHHHAFEMPPTAGELGTWLESVDEVVRVVAKRVA